MFRLRSKLVVSLASVAASLGLVEVGLRIAGYDPFGEMMRSGRQEPGELLAKDFLLESPHDVLVYELVPGGRAFAWGAEVEINSHGFRDREYELVAPEGVGRIVAIGDSATFGVKLSPDVLWPERLEVEFEGAVEVLNLGIVGYDALESVSFLEHRGLAFSPNVVVYGLHVNDVGYASPTRDYIQRLKSYGSSIYRVRTLQFLRASIDRIEIGREQERRASEAYFVEENARYLGGLADDPEGLALVERFRALRDERGALRGRHRYVAWYGSEARIEKLRFALERLGNLADEHGFEPLVFVVPWLGDGGYEDVYDLAYSIVEREAERAGLGFLNPVKATRVAGHRDLQISDEDYGHPNSVGHAILARLVRERIDEEGWFGVEARVED